MSYITKVIDGDTFETDEDKLRVSNIDTPESVHTNPDRNTEEGKQASKQIKGLVPVGSQVEVEETDRDNFGRKVADVSRVINGVPINMGFVALDQDLSEYYTRFGEHDDPEKHDMYKEYYSKDVPYQFGDNRSPITQEEFNDVAEKQHRFREVQSRFAEGEATQDEVDTAMVDLYSDPVKVANFRKALNNWNRPVEQEDPTSLRGAMRIAMQNPTLRDTYNRAVRNGNLVVKPYAPEASVWDNMKNSMTLFSGVSDAMDLKELWSSRQNKAELEVPAELITQGVPEEYHAKLFDEATTYSGRSALVMRDQIIEDIDNNKQFDDMSMIAQFGYGAAATIINPLTLVPAASIARVGKATVDTAKYWQISRAMQGKARSTSIDVGTKLAAWAAVGGVEGGLVNAPRLAADHTYTPKDYMLDTVFDAGLGIALGSAGTGVKKAYTSYTSKLRDSRQKTKDEIANLAVNKEAPQVAEAVLIQPEEAIKVDKALKQSGETVSKWTQQPKVKIEATPEKFTPLAAVTKVSPEGMQTASKTLRNVFTDKTPMRYLLNSATGLSRKELPESLQDEVAKLNADILHVASAFPDGKVTPAISTAIKQLTFQQKTHSTNNALADVLRGENVKNQVETLEKYVNSLRNKTELWGNTPITSFDSSTFIRMQSSWLNYQSKVDDEALTTMRAELPKQMSYLKDLVELNLMAQKAHDPKLNQIIGELNGMAVRRVQDADKGELPQYSDSSKSWGKTVVMSPQEIQAQLKKEGLQPRTPEYTARMKELRQSGMQVSDEVNAVGQLNERVIGEEYNEAQIGGEQHYSRDDMLGELQSLQKKSGVDKDDVTEASVLTKRLESTQGSRVTLTKEDFEQDLLPRSFVESTEHSAFKEPTLESIKALRKQLNDNVIKKLGVKIITKKEDPQHVADRLVKVKKALLKDKTATIDRMVRAGKWQNIEDVLRASAQIVEDKKNLRGTKTNQSTSAELQSTEEQIPTPLTEDEVELITDYTSGVNTVVNPTTIGDIAEKIQVATNATMDASLQKLNRVLTQFDGSSEKKAWELAKKPVGLTDRVGRAAAKITEDLASKFQNSKLNSLEYVGSRVTELGKGYGGNIRRRHTGGVIRDAMYKEAVMQIAPQYVRIMDDYAKSKGRGAWSTLKAQWQAGADNPLVDAFNREVFTVQELRRQGKQTDTANKYVLEFVDNWDKFTEYTHNSYVDNNISGFTKERKVKHYIPHVWKDSSLRSAIDKVGVEQVTDLFEKAYKSAINNGTNPSKLRDARGLAEKQVKWILDQGEPDTAVDQYSPVSDSRAKKRLDLDTTTELNGVSIMDLLDTDVINVGTKYANRYAGWIGLAKSTDGAITSPTDIDALKAVIVQEGLDKGIRTSTYEQYYDDLMNMMFGRPTSNYINPSNGLTTELRDLKDLTALTRMGGLGMAQLIESGTVVTRSVLSLFSSDPVVKKIFAVAKESPKDEGLLSEIQSISSVTDDLEFMDRQSVHLDQAELQKVNKLRQVSLWAANKATFGSTKAPASRLLGKVTGYNAIRKAQSRIVQASFTVDVARHFKSRNAKMSVDRLADLGLVDTDGTDTGLQEVFDKFVEYDNNGLVSKLNFQKWPKETRDRFQFAMLRDDAQQIQRTLIGEMPPWMNKPMMALVMQFRQMPIVANNKQLARSMAFADREAVTAIMLNSAIAGLVRYSKFAALGTGTALLTGEEAEEPTSDQMQTSKYIALFGIYADMIDLVTSAFNAGQMDTPKDSFNEAADVVLNQVPVLGLMADYREAGKGAAATMGADIDMSVKEQIDAAYGLMPLGNIAFADMIHAWMNKHFGEE